MSESTGAAGLAISAETASLDRCLVSGTPMECAAHFTADAVVGESGMADVTGRDAIAGFFEAGNRVRAVTAHRIERDELIFVGERRAIEFGRFDETKVKAGQAPIHERGRTVTEWRLEPDGRWRIARLVVSDLPPS